MLVTSLVFCTLLGPEGPAGIRKDAVTDLWTTVTKVTRSSDPGIGQNVFLVGRGYRPYFENYTVDASILKMQTN